jgi:uncharacterized membrane protein YbhN (UPF0104 family)
VNKTLGNIFKLVISLGLGVALIWWVISHMSDNERQHTIDAFKRAKFGWLLLAPVLGLISNLSRTQRWRLLLEPTGHKPAYWNTFFSVMMMYFFNLFFPRLGEVTRCSVLARYENVPIDKSIGTMVVERFVDLLSILFVGGLLFIFEHERLITFWENRNSISGGAASVDDGSGTIKLVVFAVVALMLIFGVAYLQRKVGFDRLMQIAKERILGFWEGIKSIAKLRSPLEFLFHTIVIWTCYIGMVYVSLPALTETQGLGWLAAMACLFCGGFAIVLSPGGVGFYPLFIQFILAMYGVDKTIAYAFGSIVWAVQFGTTLLGGVISLMLLAILNKDTALNQEPLNS